MIFKSDDSARLTNHFAEEGESYWSYIELAINSMWFVVKVSSCGDESTLSSTLLLSSKIQLATLSKRADVRIIEVYLMSPPHKNEEKTWKLLHVSKILQYIHAEKDVNEQTFKYIFTDGNELIDTSLLNNVPRSAVFETIYCLQ